MEFNQNNPREIIIIIINLVLGVSAIISIVFFWYGVIKLLYKSTRNTIFFIKHKDSSVEDVLDLKKEKKFILIGFIIGLVTFIIFATTTFV